MTDDKKNSLEILIIPDLIPFPPNDGGRLCVFGLIDYLRNFHKVHLLLSAFSQQDIDVIQSLTDNWPNVIIHVVEQFSTAPVLKPKPQISKQIKRIIKVSVSFFKKNRSQLPGPAKHIFGHYNELQASPFYPHNQLFIKKLTEVFIQNRFDIVQTELTRMLNLVDLFPKESKKIFVEIESRHAILYDYGRANNFNEDFIEHVAGNAKALEYFYMGKYDAILALNDLDKKRIKENVPSAVGVYTSPFGILDIDIKEIDRKNYKADHLIFMGSENHFPNVDALDWFLTEVMSQFEKRPFNKLYITGKWSESIKHKYKALADCVDFIGFVDDLQPYLQNSVSIVPIRIGGGGIRTKILSAMSFGSPVVATTLSAVGVKGINSKEILIADTAAEFANAINLLFEDDSFASTIAYNGYRLIVDEYRQSVVGEKRNKIYDEITKRPTP